MSHLRSRIRDKDKAVSVLLRMQQFERQSPEEQQQALAQIYLLVERYIVDVEKQSRLTRDSLRKEVAAKFQPLLKQERFELIFLPQREQEMMLCKYLMQDILQQSLKLLGAAGGNFLQQAKEWIDSIPQVDWSKRPPDFPAATSVKKTVWTAYLQELGAALYGRL